MPSGVSTSTHISSSASDQTSGLKKLVTWRVDWPAPRSSTGTASAGPYRGGRFVAQRAVAIATSPPPSAVSVTVVSRPT